MKKLFLLGAMALAGVAQAASYDDVARVVGVQERYDNNQATRTVCDGPAQGQNTVGIGTVLGTVAGGIIGAQVGKGNGRVAGAAVGAAAGAVTGNRLENSDSANAGGRNCYQANTGGRVIGYTVTYEYQGRTFSEYAPNPPMGDTMKVRVSVMPVR